jgi:hypothetical protein
VNKHPKAQILEPVNPFGPIGGLCLGICANRYKSPEQKSNKQFHFHNDTQTGKALGSWLGFSEDEKIRLPALKITDNKVILFNYRYLFATLNTLAGFHSDFYVPGSILQRQTVCHENNTPWFAPAFLHQPDGTGN